jgi:hypothetical protein
MSRRRHTGERSHPYGSVALRLARGSAAPDPGRTVFRCQRPRVENKVPIGLVRHLPEASSAWAEVERLHVPINRVDMRRGLTFGDLAQHYAEHELVEDPENLTSNAR